METPEVIIRGIGIGVLTVIFIIINISIQNT